MLSVPDLGVGWRVPDGVYQCFVSTRTPGGPFAYSSTRATLRFTGGVTGGRGRSLAYRVQVRTAGGELLRVVNCAVPASAAAIALVDRWAGVPAGARTGKDDAVVQGCVADQLCPLEPIVVIGEPQPQDPCITSISPGGGDLVRVQACEPIPGSGSYTPPPYSGGSGGGGGSSPGNGSPCVDCGPATPIVSCTTVTRGEVTTCTVSWGTGSATNAVTVWQFMGDAGPVAGPGGSPQWSGQAVAEGVVSATLDNGQVLQTKLGITARPWKWGKAHWSFTQGAAALATNEEPGLGVRLGWSCKVGTRDDCLYGRWIEPDLDQKLNEGYTITSVTGGPNNGLWYVAAAAFKSTRASGINPQVTSSGQTRLLTDPTQAQQCRQAMGLASGSAVYVNFYTFNSRCMGINMAAFVEAIWSHEGYGSGAGNGHQAEGEAAAMSNDPYAAVERLASVTDYDLHFRVASAVNPLNGAITNASRVEPTGNWSGRLWFWSAAESRYVLTNLNPF